MSAVLMCDSCGEMFSVNDEGWEQLSKRIPESKNNPHNNGVMVFHTGPCCVFKHSTVKPKVGGQMGEQQIKQIEKSIRNNGDDTSESSNYVDVAEYTEDHRDTM